MNKALLANLALLFFTVSSFAQKSPPQPKPKGGVLSGIPAGAASSEQTAMREFVCEKGNFKLMLPGEPSEGAHEEETEVGRVPVYTYAAIDSPLYYAVMFADYPISFDQPVVVNRVLDRIRDIDVKTRNATLLDEQEITFRQFTGRDLMMKTPVGLVKSRIFLVKNRLYMLSVAVVGADEKALKPSQVNLFMESFTFLQSPQALPPPAMSASNLRAEVAKQPPLPPDFYTRPANWQDFETAEFGFKTRFPTEPIQRNITPNPSEPRMTLRVWMARADGILCEVVSQPVLAKARDPKDLKDFFVGMREAMLSGQRVEVISESEIKLDGHEGREIKLQIKGQQGIARAFITEERAYFLLTLSVSADSNERGMSQFLDSFKILATPATQLPTAGAVIATSEWREYSYEDYGFKIALPGKPSRNEAPRYQAPSLTLIANGDGVMSTVFSRQAPEPLSKRTNINELFKSFEQGLKSSLKLTTLNEKVITLDGHPGREWVVNVGNLKGICRAYLVSRKSRMPYLYSITAISQDSEAGGVRKILDSFQITDIHDIAPPPPPPPPAPAPAAGTSMPVPKKIQVSGGVLQANAIKKVSPKYPPEAKQERVQGEVRIQILISEEGQVLEATVLSGPESLQEVSLEAAKQWQFKPTELSGVPVKVQGVLTFNFTLQ